MQLQGVLPILPTPFTDHGAVDETSLRRLIDFELEVGAHGVSILGFMGEAHRLATTERSHIVTTVVDQAGVAFPTWVGVLAPTKTQVTTAERRSQAIANSTKLNPLARATSCNRLAIAK